MHFVAFPIAYALAYLGNLEKLYNSYNLDNLAGLTNTRWIVLQYNTKGPELYWMVDILKVQELYCSVLFKFEFLLNCIGIVLESFS